MLIKEILFGETASQYGIPTTPAPMYVMESGHSSSEINSMWGGMPSSTSVEDVMNNLVAYSIGGGGFPCYFPGQYTGTGTPEDNANYTYYLQATPYSAQLSGTRDTSLRLKYCDKNGNGLSLNNSGIEFVMNGSRVALYSSQIPSLGMVYSGSGASPGITSRGIFITSDSLVGYYRLGSNKNNSAIGYFSASASVQLIAWLNGLPDLSFDPYEQDPDGPSGTGGGTGNFDGTGDDIDIPSLPTLSATDTGFITLFNPTTGQLQSLANYMWSSGFDLDTFKKLFADPMDCILGLSIVPVAVPNGGTRQVSVGNISTGVSMTIAARQYVEVDCGTLNVNEYWGAYLDYAPYTKAEIYLPYIGTHPLDVDDIMNKAVHVVYHVDILSGACTAFVKCGGSVLYEFIGQCSSSIPITGNDWTNVINGVISIAGAIGSMVATGGASAPMAAGIIASTAVNSMKPTVEKSGSMSGTGGMLAVQTPYLILTRPRQALPSRQNAFTGYPSFITRELDTISGYTEIYSIHLENVPATEQELSEIENLLKSGVIF